MICIILFYSIYSDYAPADGLDHYDPTVLAADDDEELFESYEKRIRDRISAEEELDALDMKRRERDIQTENNLERISRFEQQELDIEEEDDEEDGRIRLREMFEYMCGRAR